MLATGSANVGGFAGPRLSSDAGPSVNEAAPPSALPRAGPAPDGADSATRGGSFVPPRTPFLSATIERVSFFRLSGCEN